MTINIQVLLKREKKEQNTEGNTRAMGEQVWETAKKQTRGNGGRLFACSTGGN